MGVEKGDKRIDIMRYNKPIKSHYCNELVKETYSVKDGEGNEIIYLEYGEYIPFAERNRMIKFLNDNY